MDRETFSRTSFLKKTTEFHRVNNVLDIYIHKNVIARIDFLESRRDNDGDFFNSFTRVKWEVSLKRILTVYQFYRPHFSRPEKLSRGHLAPYWGPNRAKFFERVATIYQSVLKGLFYHFLDETSKKENVFIHHY